jgi:heat shock protein HslJ
MSRIRAAVITAAIAAASACTSEPPPPASAEAPSSAAAAQPPAAPDAAGLAGTTWRLLQFQSMDDAQGVTRTEDPSLYVLELHEDGTVAMRLNCNRATGTWSAEPSAGGASGLFTFGPLAMTRASCPPPSLDEKIARDAQYVTAYLRRDGRLYLSLMADGGIYAWEPAPERVAFEAVPNAEIEAAVRDASPSYTRDVVDAGGGALARYVYSRFDLDEDGQAEVLVYLLGPFFCGSGGCNLQLFTRRGGSYALVNDFPITRTPVVVAATSSRGWRDLWRLRAGGGAPANYIANRFDGERYVEGETLPADRPPKGISVLAGELDFARGIPLAPRE